MSPSTGRAGLVAHYVALRRQIAGQIPWDHPLSQMNREQYAGFTSHLVPPDVMSKRLTDDEMAQARAHIARLKGEGKAR